MHDAAASPLAPTQSQAPARPYVVFEDGREGGRALLFDAPEEIILAREPGEVRDAFARMEAATKRGLYLAGYASYELGYALEPKFWTQTTPRSRTPLLLFGAFKAPKPWTLPPAEGPAPNIPLTPAWTEAEYAERFRACIDYIFAGDVYQINLTFPLYGRHEGDPLALYRGLRKRQPVAYGGVVALGEETVVSLSPEVFFEAQFRNGAIRARPMKGTAQRGFMPTEDMARAQYLVEDEKSRAENLMIVDLLRNDLSRLAEVGSVKVTDLFTIQTYPTLHQMTSGIEARLRDDVTLADLFTGLFPCGSVTGAPKIRAMEIIRDLECAARGVYCGSLGVIAPDGDIRFNVAIRTLTLFPGGELVCNVGSAVVADSRAAQEYEECLIKARFLTGAKTSG